MKIQDVMLLAVEKCLNEVYGARRLRFSPIMMGESRDVSVIEIEIDGEAYVVTVKKGR